MKKIVSSLAVVAILFLISQQVKANGLAGLRLESVQGSYIVDVGTDQFGTPDPNTPIQFDFNLLASDTRLYLSFDHVLVQITNPDGSDLLKKDIPESADGFTAFLATFPKVGLYTLKVNIFKDSKDVADGSFPIQVGPPPAPNLNFGQTTYLIAGGVIVLAVVFAVIWRAKKMSH